MNDYIQDLETVGSVKPQLETLNNLMEKLDVNDSSLQTINSWILKVQDQVVLILEDPITTQRATFRDQNKEFCENLIRERHSMKVMYEKNKPTESVKIWGLYKHDILATVQQLECKDLDLDDW